MGELDLVACPTCGVPAEVTDRYVLESTDGPIEHATVACAGRHRWTVFVENLGSRPAAVRRDAEPQSRTG